MPYRIDTLKDISITKKKIKKIMSYKKKLLIITGAGQGIGRELALNAPRNFDLILISKTSNCQKVADEIKGK